MSHSADKLAALVASYNGRIIMIGPLIERYHRELPEGGSHLKETTVKRYLRAHPFVEAVKTAGEGCSATLIGYRAVSQYKHPGSHAWDAFMALTGPQQGIFMSIVGGTLLLAGQHLLYLLTGGFE